MVSIATAEGLVEALNVPVPIGVVPSRKVTVMVGVLAPVVGVTVAVKVTALAENTGLALEVSVVVVGWTLMTLTTSQTEVLE
jgi:hypothetical protein